MQFTPAHLDEILAFNWPVAARLVAWARALAGLAAATLPKCVLVEARAILRPAESFIRRLIVIMACRIELPALPSSRTRTAKWPDDPKPPLVRTPTPGQLGCAEPITFSTEPFPKIAPFIHPGIWAPGMTRYTPPTPEELAAAPLPAMAFFARLARLEAVLAAPDSAARRLARWLARHKPLRRLPVRPWGMMPGRNAGALDRLTRDRITYTAWAAQAALCEGAWNSS